MLVPDICHDGHDCSLRTADTWLRGWLPVLTAGPDFRHGRLAVVVTFDEDDGSAANRVLTVVIASPLHGRVVKARLSHLALSHWLSDVAGAPPLRDAGSVGSLGAAFGLEG
jgi:acid phosphatase